MPNHEADCEAGPRYIVASCRDAFVVIDTAATVPTLPGCRLAVDGPFAPHAVAAASCAALNRRR